MKSSEFHRLVRRMGGRTSAPMEVIIYTKKMAGHILFPSMAERKSVKVCGKK